MSELYRLTSAGLGDARAARPRIARLAYEEALARGAARPPAAPGEAALSAAAEAWASSVLSGSLSLTLLAGSGSRWVRSLEAARRGDCPPGLERARDFDPSLPRGLFPVSDRLGLGAVPGLPPGTIPVAAYALAAVRGLPRHLVVVRGAEAEIEARILAPLGMAPPASRFRSQEAPYGKPLGHGDAAWQCRDLLAGSEWVIANFGGDANSRLTVESSLLALAALAPSGVDLVIPAAPVPSPAYPIQLDAEGLPRGFGHAKLQGAAASGSAGGGLAGAGSLGYTNVGLRAYRVSALLEALDDFRRRYWVEGKGYAIPGNDPEGREFALDNVDALFAAQGRARVLAIADPDELTPAKALEDVPAFEAAAAGVVARDRAVLG